MNINAMIPWLRISKFSEEIKQMHNYPLKIRSELKVACLWLADAL